MPRITEINTVEEYENALNTNSKLILKFSASWCNPCKSLVTFYENLSDLKNLQNVTFCSVDFDNEDLKEIITTTHEVVKIPTILFISDKNEVGRVLGISQKEIVNTAVALSLLE
jgi:thioredoxin 1